jgi:hypothetical protein
MSTAVISAVVDFHAAVVDYAVMDASTIYVITVLTSSNVKKDISWFGVVYHWVLML